MVIMRMTVLILVVEDHFVCLLLTSPLVSLFLLELFFVEFQNGYPEEKLCRKPLNVNLILSEEQYSKAPSHPVSSFPLTSGLGTSDPGKCDLKSENIGLPVELRMPSFQMND